MCQAVNNTHDVIVPLSIVKSQLFLYRKNDPILTLSIIAERLTIHTFAVPAGSGYKLAHTPGGKCSCKMQNGHQWTRNATYLQLLLIILSSIIQFFWCLLVRGIQFWCLFWCQVNLKAIQVTSLLVYFQNGLFLSITCLHDMKRSLFFLTLCYICVHPLHWLDI